MSFTLYDAVHSEGYSLVTFPRPWEHPDALGSRVEGSQAQVCAHNRIACIGDSWDHAYSVAHEIAEHRNGFEHSARMFAEQANILARWCRRLGAAIDKLESQPRPVDNGKENDGAG
jgi:hypothetical protein